MQCPGSNRSSTATIALPIQVSVQLFSFFPNTEEIVSCILPNEYQPEVISNLFSISLQTEFPIWSSPIAILRIIEERYQSDFFPALAPLGKRNLIPISTLVHRMPSGSITHARATDTMRRSWLLRSLSILFLVSI